MRASADCLQVAANSASPWKKLPACALEFTGRVEIWTPTRYLEDTRFRLDEPPGKSRFYRFSTAEQPFWGDSKRATRAAAAAAAAETETALRIWVYIETSKTP